MIKSLGYPLLIVAFLLPALCPAQKFIAFETYDVDSLLRVLPGQSGKERVNTLNWLAASYSFVDEKLSLGYADSAMALAEQVGFREGMADAYRNYGHIYYYFEQCPLALNNYFAALSVFQELDNRYKEFWIYYFIAKTHYLANNKDKTIEYGNIALTKCLAPLPGGGTVGTVNDMATIWLGLAETLTDMGRVEESKEIRKEMLGIMKANDFSNIEILLTTWTIGADYYGLGKPDSARAYFNEAISLAGEDISSQAQKYRALMWLADLQESVGIKDSAIYNMQNALDWYDEHGILMWAVYASNYLGDFYYGMNDMHHAEASFRRSEKYFDEMLSSNSFYRSDLPRNTAFYGFELYFPVPPRILKELMWAWGIWLYEGLYLIYQKQNMEKEALHYHILYTNARDTLNLIQQNRETVEFQTRYESDQKERQIQQLSDQNAFKTYKLRQSRIYLFGLAGLITLVILLAIALIRHGRLREKQNSMILQQKLFRAQMNPHFIFNSLSSIHHFMINEKPAKAASYLSKFSKLIRNILQGSTEEYASLNNEIGIIENYLELQKLRFPGKFDFSIELDEALDPDHVRIPSMIIQPFVENAIEHGIRNKDQKGMVRVGFALTEDIITIVVEDDGIGRKKSGEISSSPNNDHKSLATSLIHERIRALNRTLRKKISLEITDLFNERGEAAGTLVRLEVPVM